MKLIANQMIRGAGIVADAGDPFECSSDAGAALLDAGAARLPDEPVVETAAEQPAEKVEKAVERKAKPRSKPRRKASKKVSGKK